MGKITPNVVKVDDSKEYVLRRLGQPFKVDYEEGREVLYYKEAVAVSGVYLYISTTELTFKRSVLVRFRQFEEPWLDDVVIKRN